ncbi:YheC/YheD family protein [Anaerobacillus sp. CMMVII]|uniref:YheC/YheD family endospore coat-associated protein n=1 Tax=Anaerobacillus sp. CMMVII TaxID=2755588 RepID=UPI0021B735A1|nr:YheC/YheD family protein [Anaerobacillus sp. CMMVII]MCT8139477.1 YheC/YheD family protein [Anaerobacillus sp. CMMVII]
MPMNIFYSYNDEKWYSDCPNTVLFGKNLLPIYEYKSQRGTLFSVKQQNQKVGPLIGILASKEGRDDFYGNRSTFKRIQNYLQKHGGISFVMTPEGYQGEQIAGYLFDQGEWKLAYFPLPDVIYNRVASYQSELKLDKIKKMAFKNAIPFYNPHFFGKWETFKQLAENASLTKYLPKTKRLDHLEDLQNWLDDYQSIMVKPVLSNRGNGILSITKRGKTYEVKANGWKQCFENIADVWDAIYRDGFHQQFIIQKRIALRQLEERPYDFRILVQRMRDRWMVTGIGVRLAGHGSITTHVPHGGKILPFELVSHGIDIKEIEILASQVARQLELAYGYLCEFSIDLGIDEDNTPWLFEVNSKPMKFDEPHIQEKALKTLIECFYDDTGFI